MKEPTRITAGNSYAWSKHLKYFQSDGWTVHFSITGINNQLTFDAQEESAGHWSVSISSSQTEVLSEGEYRLIGYAKNTSLDQRVTFYSNFLKVRPDFSQATDLRSYAEKTLEAIEAMILKSASKDQQSVTVDGQTLSRRSVPDLMLLRDRFKREVAREKDLKKSKRLGHSVGKIGIRLK